MVGVSVGDCEGNPVGVTVGCKVGSELGRAVPAATDGTKVGGGVGRFDGIPVATEVASMEGRDVGSLVDSNVGASVGDTLGSSVGMVVGALVGVKLSIETSWMMENVSERSKLFAMFTSSSLINRMMSRKRTYPFKNTSSWTFTRWQLSVIKSRLLHSSSGFALPVTKASKMTNRQASTNSSAPTLQPAMEGRTFS